MNALWTTSFSILLVALGVLAELNLLRIFIGDWREGRRDAGQRTLPARPRERVFEAPHRMAPVRRRVLTACLGAPAMIGSVAHAQESDTTGQPIAPAAATEQSTLSPDAAKSPFSLQFNLDYTTAYLYHGIIQEDTGPILQPAAKLTINLYEHNDLKIDAYFATWNSFHGQKTAAQTHGDFSEYWYESDLIAGIALTKGKFSLATQYVILTSPSDAYETVQELDFTLAFDDSDLLGKFALHPYALLAIETGADASDGANSDTGTYLELGIAPGFSFDVGKTLVSMTFPASVGLSLHNYYQNSEGEDDTFGFAQVGVKASLPLPFGTRYGQWTLNAGVAAMFLGDQTTDFNGGQSEQFIGTVGVQLNF